MLDDELLALFREAGKVSLVEVFGWRTRELGLPRASFVGRLGRSRSGKLKSGSTPLNAASNVARLTPADCASGHNVSMKARKAASALAVWVATTTQITTSARADTSTPRSAIDRPAARCGGLNAFVCRTLLCPAETQVRIRALRATSPCLAQRRVRDSGLFCGSLAEIVAT